MKLAAIQHDIIWEQPERNFSLLTPLIEQAAGDGARLIVLSCLLYTSPSPRDQRGSRIACSA